MKQGLQIFQPDQGELTLVHVTSTPQELRKFWRRIRPDLSQRFTDTASVATMLANIKTDHTIREP